MDKKHLETLEFPRILQRLAQHTPFSAGRELALSLPPSPVWVEVQQRLQDTREARYLIESQGGLSLGGAHDVRPLAQSARRGVILQPQSLLDIHSTLRVSRRVSRVLARLRGQVPLLADIAARIEPCSELLDEIGRCLNQQGEVVDRASAKLARIRRELRAAGRQVDIQVFNASERQQVEAWGLDLAAYVDGEPIAWLPPSPTAVLEAVKDRMNVIAA